MDRCASPGTWTNPTSNGPTLPDAAGPAHEDQQPAEAAVEGLPDPAPGGLAWHHLLPGQTLASRPCRSVTGAAAPPCRQPPSSARLTADGARAVPPCPRRRPRQRSSCPLIRVRPAPGSDTLRRARPSAYRPAPLRQAPGRCRLLVAVCGRRAGTPPPAGQRTGDTVCRNFPGVLGRLTPRALALRTSHSRTTPQPTTGRHGTPRSASNRAQDLAQKPLTTKRSSFCTGSPIPSEPAPMTQIGIICADGSRLHLRTGLDTQEAVPMKLSLTSAFGVTSRPRAGGGVPGCTT